MEGVLQNLDLTGKNLSGVLMKNVTFSFCNLKDTIIRDVNLNGVTFYGCNMPSTDLQGCDLSHTEFTGENKLDSAKFSISRDLVKAYNEINTTIKNRTKEAWQQEKGASFRVQVPFMVIHMMVVHSRNQ